MEGPSPDKQDDFVCKQDGIGSVCVDEEKMSDGAGLAWKNGPSRSPMVLQVTENAMALSTGGDYLAEPAFQRGGLFPGYGVPTVSSDEEDDDEAGSDGMDPAAHRALRSASSGSVLLCGGSRLGDGGASWTLGMNLIGEEDPESKRDSDYWPLMTASADVDGKLGLSTAAEAPGEKSEETGRKKEEGGMSKRPRRAAAQAARNRLGSQPTRGKTAEKKTKVKETSKEEANSSESDGEESSESDDAALWCVCSKPHGNRFMIACDRCSEWYHGGCVGITKARGRQMERSGVEWLCPVCTGQIVRPQHQVGRSKVSSASTSPERSAPEVLSTQEAQVSTGSSPTVRRGKRKRDSEQSAAQPPRTRSRRQAAAEDREEETRTTGEIKKKSEKKDREDDVRGDNMAEAPAEVKISTALAAKRQQTRRSTREKNVPSSNSRVQSPTTGEESSERRLRTRSGASSITTRKERTDVGKAEKKEGKKELAEPKEKTDGAGVQSPSPAAKRLKVDPGEKEKDVVEKADKAEVTVKIDVSERTSDGQNEAARVAEATQSPDCDIACIGRGCTRTAMKGSIYCSRDCLIRHARESLRMIQLKETEERKARKSNSIKDLTLPLHAGLPSDPISPDKRGSVNSLAASPSAGLLRKASTERPDDRVTVVDRLTGSVLTGLSAPLRSELDRFFAKHPSYEVVRSVADAGRRLSPAARDSRPVDRSHSSPRGRNDSYTDGDRRTSTDSHDGYAHSNRRRERGVKNEQRPRPRSSSHDHGGSNRHSLNNSGSTADGDDGELSSTKKVENVRKGVLQLLKDTLVKRCREADDVTVSEEVVFRRAQRIEEALFSTFGNTRSDYREAFRRIIQPLRSSKNTGLFRQIATGHMRARSLVQLSTEELNAEPISKWRPPTPSKDGGETVGGVLRLLDDATSQHGSHLFDVNCHICQARQKQDGDEEPKEEKEEETKPATTFGREDTDESNSPPHPPSGRVRTLKAPPDPAKDPDAYSEYMDELCASPVDPEPSTPASTGGPPPSRRQQRVCAWKGYITMTNLTKFASMAYVVSGPSDHLMSLLPDTIHLTGRTSPAQILEYVEQLKKSSSRDVCIVYMEPTTDDEQSAYMALFAYLYQKKRCGVCRDVKMPVRDCYLMPLSVQDDVPPALLPFSGPGLPPHMPQVLIAIVIRNRLKRRVQPEQTPAQKKPCVPSDGRHDDDILKSDATIDSTADEGTLPYDPEALMDSSETQRLEPTDDVQLLVVYSAQLRLARVQIRSPQASIHRSAVIEKLQAAQRRLEERHKQLAKEEEETRERSEAGEGEEGGVEEAAWPAWPAPGEKVTLAEIKLPLNKPEVEEQKVSKVEPFRFLSLIEEIKVELEIAEAVAVEASPPSPTNSDGFFDDLQGADAYSFATNEENSTADEGSTGKVVSMTEESSVKKDEAKEDVAKEEEEAKVVSGRVSDDAAPAGPKKDRIIDKEDDGPVELDKFGRAKSLRQYIKRSPPHSRSPQHHDHADHRHSYRRGSSERDERDRHHHRQSSSDCHDWPRRSSSSSSSRSESHRRRYNERHSYSSDRHVGRDSAEQEYQEREGKDGESQGKDSSWAHVRHETVDYGHGRLPVQRMPDSGTEGGTETHSWPGSSSHGDDSQWNEANSWSHGDVSWHGDNKGEQDKATAGAWLMDSQNQSLPRPASVERHVNSGPAAGKDNTLLPPGQDNALLAAPRTAESQQRNFGYSLQAEHWQGAGECYQPGGGAETGSGAFQAAPPTAAADICGPRRAPQSTAPYASPQVSNEQTPSVIEARPRGPHSLSGQNSVASLVDQKHVHNQPSDRYRMMSSVGASAHGWLETMGGRDSGGWPPAEAPLPCSSWREHAPAPNPVPVAMPEPFKDTYSRPSLDSHPHVADYQQQFSDSHSHFSASSSSSTHFVSADVDPLSHSHVSAAQLDVSNNTLTDGGGEYEQTRTIPHDSHRQPPQPEVQSRYSAFSHRPKDDEWRSGDHEPAVDIHTGTLPSTTIRTETFPRTHFRQSREGSGKRGGFPAARSQERPFRRSSYRNTDSDDVGHCYGNNPSHASHQQMQRDGSDSAYTPANWPRSGSRGVPRFRTRRGHRGAWW